MVDDRDDSGQPNERSRSFGRGGGSGRSARNMIQPDSVAKPTARSNAARNPFIVAGNAIFVILVLIAIAGYFGIRRFSSPGPLTEAKTVYVPRGSGRDEIADSLERQGVIDSAGVFTTGATLLGHGYDMKAGEYAFQPGASMYEVMDILTSGKAIQHTLTIPEGLTSQQIVDKLNQDDLLQGDIAQVPGEGSLLPDTYKYERGTTRSAMLRRMQDEQKDVLDQIWKARTASLPLKSPAELVTLASIVEKETGVAGERPHVASVFVNRLQQNMRLQSDPTVIYGIVGGKGKLDRPLTSADLSQPTRFNTYTMQGLPPSPIANPGRAAMEAVANPLVSKDLYFVADGTGGHAFAPTLQEHNRNVQRWRQIQQQGGNAAPVVPAPAQPADAAPAPVVATPPPAPAELPKPCKKNDRACKKRQQEQQAAPGNAAPAAVAPSAPADAAGSAPPDPAAAVEATQPDGKPRKGAFDDPVANTNHDPLLDKTFDLNSPQSVQ